MEKGKPNNNYLAIEDWSKEDLVSATDTLIDLSEILHDNEDLIVPKLKAKIQDLMYKHFEP